MIPAEVPQRSHQFWAGARVPSLGAESDFSVRLAHDAQRADLELEALALSALHLDAMARHLGRPPRLGEVVEGAVRTEIDWMLRAFDGTTAQDAFLCRLWAVLDAMRWGDEAVEEFRWVTVPGVCDHGDLDGTEMSWGDADMLPGQLSHCRCYSVPIIWLHEVDCWQPREGLALAMLCHEAEGEALWRLAVWFAAQGRKANPIAKEMRDRGGVYIQLRHAARRGALGPKGTAQLAGMLERIRWRSARSIAGLLPWYWREESALRNGRAGLARLQEQVIAGYAAGLLTDGDVRRVLNIAVRIDVVLVMTSLSRSERWILMRELLHEAAKTIAFMKRQPKDKLTA